jgi:hypothetical protein
MGTQLREAESGFRYTPSTTFETFPFPEPTTEQSNRIADAAAKLSHLRTQWLDPPGQDAAMLKGRTLTNLYNEPPTWLQQLHGELDASVAAAYGWPSEISDEDLLEALLAMNLERSDHPTSSQASLLH